MGKIMTGLFVTIVGGLVVAYFTGAFDGNRGGGTIVPPSKPADLKVQGSLVRPYRANQTNSYTFTISNFGGTASEPCILEITLHKDNGNTFSFMSRNIENLVHAENAWWHVPSIQPGQTLKAKGTTGGLIRGLWTLDSKLYSEIPRGEGLQPLAKHQSFVEAN